MLPSHPLSPPAALPLEELPALRTITVAGEALPAELVGRWGVRHRLWNLYGPTEATIWSTVSECADPARTPDIGHPIANTRAYVLDAALEPLPAAWRASCTWAAPGWRAATWAGRG